jgi:effector-binding domain-containing protein
MGEKLTVPRATIIKAYKAAYLAASGDVTRDLRYKNGYYIMGKSQFIYFRKTHDEMIQEIKKLIEAAEQRALKDRGS